MKRGVFSMSALLFILWGGIAPLFAQNTAKMAKSAERRWAITHPFIARGCLKKTNEALLLVNQSIGRYGLDTSLSEGSFDAFRHGYWMASLAQHYRVSKVLKLGEAHEKSNYHTFRLNLKEHGMMPDKPNSEMDLWNNKTGAEIGRLNKNVSKDSLRTLIINALDKGSFRVIKKDEKGNYLDCNGSIIPPEKTKGTWKNPKCLSPSFLSK